MATRQPQDNRIEALFDEALSRLPSKRHAFLDACGDEPAVVARVKALLAASNGAQAFFDDVFEFTLFDPGPVAVENQLFGAYRIIEPIGNGGMGRVYLAERADEEFRQRVAIKILAPNALDPSAIDRFQREKNMLGELEHPNIAHIIDSGTSENGRPYMVMEYVRGARIDNYCRGQHLPVTERLRLLEPLCDAVASAHSRLIVHRDLKPPNILVTTDGQLKILDFGIGAYLSQDSELTQVSGRPLTLAYAAPEFCLGHKTTVAMDVYSVGIVMYKLLCGLLPFDLQELRRAFHSHTPPPEPPTMLARIAKAAPDQLSLLAKRRGTSSGNLHKILGGDLQAIVGKAIRIDPSMRYASVDALWSDIDRYLNARPVKAQPPSAWYRTRKWLYRERWRLAVASLILLLVGAVAVQGRLVAVQATRQARAIAVERDNTKAVAGLLAEIFRSADPTRPDAGSVTVLEALAEQAPRIVEQLNEQPDLQRRFAYEIGAIYADRELYQEAEPYLTRVNSSLDLIAVRRALTQAESQLHTDTAVVLVKVLKGTGRYAQASAMADRAETLAATVFREDDDRLLAIMNSRTEIFLAQGSVEQAIVAAEKAVNFAKLNTPLDFGQRALAYNNLAIAYHDQRPSVEVTAALEATLRVQLTGLPETHPQVLRVRANLASAYLQTGRFDQAAEQHRKVIDAAARQGTRPTRSVAQVAYVLGAIQLRNGDFDAAFANLSDALDIQLYYKDADDPESLVVAVALATCVDGLGQLEQAATQYHELIKLAERTGAGAALIAKLHVRRAGVTLALGDRDNAAQLVRAARRALGDTATPSPVDAAYLEAMEASLGYAPSNDVTVSETMREALAIVVKHAGINAVQSLRIRKWLEDADEQS